MKVSTEIDNKFGYEKITQLVDNIPFVFYIILTTVAVYWISCVSVMDTLHNINKKYIYTFVQSMLTQKMSCVIYKDNKKR